MYKIVNINNYSFNAPIKNSPCPSTPSTPVAEGDRTILSNKFSDLSLPETPYESSGIVEIEEDEEMEEMGEMEEDEEIMMDEEEVTFFLKLNTLFWTISIYSANSCPK